MTAFPRAFDWRARNDVKRLIQLWPRGRRLKGLEEFETPQFVGRMERVERRRKIQWWAMLAGAAAIGAGIGLVLT